MGNAKTDELRIAAQGLVLADAQRHILAYRLSRKLNRRALGDVTSNELLTLIDQSMCDMGARVELQEISEDSYRENRVVQLA